MDTIMNDKIMLIPNYFRYNYPSFRLKLLMKKLDHSCLDFSAQSRFKQKYIVFIKLWEPVSFPVPFLPENCT